ncbi:MAG: primosomal protein N' [Anaerofustis sp.]
MEYAQVFIDNPSAATDQVYDYRVPEHMKQMIEPAMRVAVPFGKGNRLCQAFVIGLDDSCNYEASKIKEIAELIDIEPIIPRYLIDVAVFLREEYFCTYAEAVRTVLPSTDRAIKKVTYQKNDAMILSKEECSDGCSNVYEIIVKNPGISAQNIKSKTGFTTETVKQELGWLLKKHYIESAESFLTGRKELYEDWFFIDDAEVSLEDYLMIVGTRAKKQREIVSYLYLHTEGVSKKELQDQTGATSTMIQKLMDLFLIRVQKKKIESLPSSTPIEDAQVLNSDQEKALNEYLSDSIEENKFLLFGVTGSGKTAVYFRMFKEMIVNGKQCLLLVPEISLTPQMMALVKSCFGDIVAVMHSKLTPNERYEEFLKVKSGAAKIVLGARSALFMPFRELGLIVVDEEHETSYKSSQSPRYDTVEVANYISDRLGCHLILSSATPSPETYWKALSGQYHLLHLPNRANGTPLPAISMIDMRAELYSGNRTPISRALKTKIKDRLQKKEQIVLFLNRRGYNTYVFCRSCGYIEKCPNCDVSLTYHIHDQSMSCHYCGYKKQMPQTCPSCGSEKIKHMGTGTEKIEQFIKQLFPSARVLRLDSDTARYKGAYESILGSFAKGDADILIGTQMVVKGLDFGNVSLVGILLADTSLNFPDLNAAARTYQLTEQAAGRAGRRAEQGEVILQTYQPDDPTLVFASLHDYDGFYQYDIAHRKKMEYPPFTEIIGIFTASASEEESLKDCLDLYEKVKRIALDLRDERVKLYEPAPAFIQKLKNKFIYHMLVRYPKDSVFKKSFRNEYNEIKVSLKSNVFVEINPITLL